MLVLCPALMLGAISCTTEADKTEAKPTVTATRSITASPSPSCAPKPGKKGAKVVAEKNGVQVTDPVLKDSGDAFWVGISVTNCGSEPAKYQATVRVIGELGYFVMLDVDTDAIQPGETSSSVQTAADTTKGTATPKKATVSITRVVRTPR
ncbi:hypothetical protein ACQUSR_27040 [Streptomyces sp. P1-3]|uniref:hypothetical protein n=1 Tax=Streptomyces sp. P1-3 TaxID=3421658 RepID=UPI003D36F3DA